MRDASLNALLECMQRTGERLLAALSEEERLACVACKFSDDAEAYRSWAKARQIAEECHIAHCQAVKECNALLVNGIKVEIDADQLRD